MTDNGRQRTEDNFHGLMDYPKVLEYMRFVEERGVHLGLENTREILARLPGTVEFDADVAGIYFIQVAGTNGKGSTSYFLTSILQAAGHTVGLFTSPHLQDIRERITVNNRLISEEDFSSSLCVVKEVAEDLLGKKRISGLPTYFEYIFLTAVRYFLWRQVTAAVLEVGLGGRLDATSTITPAVSVITNISKDHTSILGSRIKDISVEKAGIIKEGVPVVCGCSVRSISHRVIKEIARQNNAPFFNVIDSENRLEISDRGNFYRCRYTADAADYTFDLYLNGEHQAYNAACAIKAVQVLNRCTGSGETAGNTGAFAHTPVSKESVRKGISTTFIPARIEILDTRPQVILDSSHNVESTAALTNFLKEKKKNNLTLVFGVLADKNYRKMIALLLPYIENVILTEPLSKRALPAREMVRFFNSSAAGAVLVKIINNIEEAYRTARLLKKEILVTGSFYLVGAIRKMIIHNININNITPGG